MIYFNPDPLTPGTKYYEIEIDDPALIEYGFSRFKLPIDGNAIKMILDNNKDRSLITYIDFDRTSLENSLRLLETKLLDEQMVQSKAGKDTVTSLVAYFRNTCISRMEDGDPDFEFFKNGNGNRIDTLRNRCCLAGDVVSTSRRPNQPQGNQPSKCGLGASALEIRRT